MSTHTATWSRSRREIAVHGPTGEVVESRPVAHLGDQPVWELLRESPWTPLPGAQWQETTPGVWSVPVFVFPSQRAASR